MQQHKKNTKTSKFKLIKSWSVWDFEKNCGVKSSSSSSLSPATATRFSKPFFLDFANNCRLMSSSTTDSCLIILILVDGWEHVGKYQMIGISRAKKKKLAGR